MFHDYEKPLANIFKLYKIRKYKNLKNLNIWLHCQMFWLFWTPVKLRLSDSLHDKHYCIRHDLNTQILQEVTTKHRMQDTLILFGSVKKVMLTVNMAIKMKTVLAQHSKASWIHYSFIRTKEQDGNEAFMKWK